MSWGAFRDVADGAGANEGTRDSMSDTTPLSTAEWGQVGTALKFMWLALLCAIIAGASLMTAHAFIPSAVATGTIPAKFERLRMPLYATGLAAVAGVVVMFVLAGVNADDIVRRMHPRYWQ